MKQTSSAIDTDSSLESKILRRKKVEQAIYESEKQLRDLVQERTAELLEANRLLKKEILERKEAENALRKNEEKYRVLFENNPVETVIVDLEARVTGYNLAKVGSGARLPKIGDVMYHDYAGKHDINMLEELTECIRSGKSKEFPALIYKGKYLHIRISPFPAGAIITSIDITCSKRVEQALRDSEKRYRRLVQTIPHGIQEIDTNGTITFTNSAHANMLGYNDGELAGKSIFDQMASDSERHEMKSFLINLVKNSPEPHPYLNRLFTKEGRIIHIQTDWNYRLDNKGNVIGFISIITDITKRFRAEEDKKRLEKQLRHSQKMEAIGTLAGGIAHDFNNILGSILLNTELALDDTGSEDCDIKYSLDQIIKGSHRAKYLVEQILTFSREAEVERVPLKISSIVKETLKMLRAVLPATIMIQQDISDQTGTVLADATQVQQLTINLCQNAAQAMSSTGGELKVELANKKIDSSPPGSDLPLGNYVSIVISDAGCGIGSEIKDRIFDPFFTTKRPGEGTGLGLSVVHGIIVNHEGAITVSSEKGRGARFEVLLPIIDGTVISQTGEDIETVPKGNERILFVDDEEVVVDANKRILERLGYNVTATLDSSDALDIFTENPDAFDLVITDMTMPHMTGAELSSKLLKTKPDIPIILCTGYSYLITPEKANAIGIREFVMKPFSRREIAETIRKVLD
ncbi:MAG: PAS domain S-box protein [Deltaproteobacteria bacterium]|nr:PAS domain S-box protein [Deltaproteobacteria bacterium]